MKYNIKIILLSSIFLALIFSSNLSLAQPGKLHKSMHRNDTASRLLMDRVLQASLVEAIDNMYNFKFEKAEVEFNWLQYRFPNHPLPSFVKGLNIWWQIVPNEDNESHDKDFLAYMDTTISKARKIYKRRSNDIEASFFLSAAYAFKGRLHSSRKNWTKATMAGKNALKYLKRGKKIEQLSPEFLFGDGLFNYYSEVIREDYPALRLVMAFFKKGDKKKGLEQLNRVSSFAFYTKVEAQYFLMRIYGNEEDKPGLSTQFAKQLYSTYPDNAYFHRYYTMRMFTQNRMTECKKLSKDMLDKVESKQLGYEAVSGRYAAYYLAYIAKSYGQRADAKNYFIRAIQYSEASNSTDSWYYQSSLKTLAEYAKEDKEFKKAKGYYTKLAKYATKKEKRNAKKEVKKIKRNKYDED